MANAPADNELRITVNSLAEKLTIVEEQVAESEDRQTKNSSAIRKEMEKFREDQQKLEKREKELDKRVEVIEKTVPSVPGRTVSHGSQAVGVPGEVGTLRNPERAGCPDQNEGALRETV